MFVILAVTTVVFGFFAVKIRFEEDLTKLIPSDETSEKTLAFGNLRVKDKIIVQLTAADGDVTPLDLSACADELVRKLYARDRDSVYLDACLYN
ncbi:MAG: hypothetical protein IKZ91_00020, partial [Bacteroidales bacterium]|nr:hypothetical protein [Bacteroidales bacterium]